jgi:hypothetical protein
MTILSTQHIPYAKRCWKSSTSEFFYIAPFGDAERDTQLVELILDNNAFIKSTVNTDALLGAKCIPQIMGFGINPWLALAEQWFSNPLFWSNSSTPHEPAASELIDKFLKITKSLGIPFADDFAAQTIANLRRRDHELRACLGILFAYLAAIRAIQRKKARLEDKLARFKAFSASDIPKFNGLNCLAMLTFYFQANRSVRGGDDAQVISFLDSFFERGKGEPEEMTAPYLRNRAADLWLWYAMPLLFQGKSQTGWAAQSTPIVVTADKFLASIPFRFIPPRLIKVGEDERFEFHFCPDGVDSDHQAQLMDIFISAQEPTGPRPSAGDKARRMANLYCEARQILDKTDRPGFESAWQEWVLPTSSE